MRGRRGCVKVCLANSRGSKKNSRRRVEPEKRISVCRGLPKKNELKGNTEGWSAMDENILFKL